MKIKTSILIIGVVAVVVNLIYGLLNSLSSDSLYFIKPQTLYQFWLIFSAISLLVLTARWASEMGGTRNSRLLS